MLLNSCLYVNISGHMVMSSWLWCHHHDLVFINVLVSFHKCFGCNEKEVLILHSLHSTSSQKSKEKLFSMMKCFSRWMITSSPARSFSLCVCVCVCPSRSEFPSVTSGLCRVCQLTSIERPSRVITSSGYARVTDAGPFISCRTVKRTTALHMLIKCSVDKGN